MQIGIISDTHDQFDRAEAAVRLLVEEGAEVLFHCGDLVEPSMIAVCAIKPCYFVYGNNDCDNVPGIRSEIAAIEGAVDLQWGGQIELSGKRIAMSHGHMHTDIRRLLAAEPDYMFSGHSHIARDWREGKTRRINPGALHRARQFSVAVLNLETDELRFLRVAK